MACLSLSIEEQRKIERLLNTWIGYTTWEVIVERIEAKLKITTTRQTLGKYGSIRIAYKAAKLRNRNKGISLQDLAKYTQTDINLIEKNMQLEVEVESLSRKVDEQLIFIKAIFSEASINPSLMMLLQDLKRKLSKKKKR